MTLDIVSFSLGIIAKKGGLTPVIGFFSSLFVRASAGEYAGYTSIATHASYWELVITTVAHGEPSANVSC